MTKSNTPRADPLERIADALERIADALEVPAKPEFQAAWRGRVYLSQEDLDAAKAGAGEPRE